MNDAPLTVVKIFTRRNDGYAMAIHGEPLDDRIIGPAVNGYYEAVADIALWRKSGELLPPCLDPEQVHHPDLPVYVTDVEYVAANPTQCPACRETFVHEVGDRGQGVGQEYQSMRCARCGSTWEVVWRPVGYIELYDRRGDT